MLQATSPFTTKEDINNCIKKVVLDGYDSALTVANTHRFTWNKDGTPINYNLLKRPRRQDFEGLLVENGAVYASTKDSLKQIRIDLEKILVLLKWLMSPYMKLIANLIG